MGHFGIKTTLEGKDVTSSELRDYSMHSELMKNMMRIQTSGAGSQAITLASHTVTIPHNLGYPPFFQLFQKMRDGSGFFFDTDYGNATAYDIDPYGATVEIIPKVDNNNLYLRWSNPSLTGFITIDYVYFIGIDPLE